MSKCLFSIQTSDIGDLCTHNSSAQSNDIFTVNGASTNSGNDNSNSKNMLPTLDDNEQAFNNNVQHFSIDIDAGQGNSKVSYNIAVALTRKIISQFFFDRLKTERKKVSHSCLDFVWFWFIFILALLLIPLFIFVFQLT